MPTLVIVTGPLASGKNAVADAVARDLGAAGRTVVVVDVDDVAADVVSPGAAALGLWFAAHEAHGALVGQWMRSAVEVVIAIGPIYSADEQRALTRFLPEGTSPLWVVLDAPVEVTLARARADDGRGLSQDPAFHRAAHERFRGLLPGISADAVFDSSELSPPQIAAAVVALLASRGHQI